MFKKKGSDILKTLQLKKNEKTQPIYVKSLI